MDIGGWLRTLGLGQHESAVCDSDIDAEVLNELTNGDLEKLGTSLGTASACSRRYQVSVRRKFRPSREAACPRRPRPNAAQQTVMFCGLLAERPDFFTVQRSERAR